MTELLIIEKIEKMKKIIFALLSLFIVIATSCTKQCNCDGGVIGTFQYLEKPIYIQPFSQFKEEKVVALFNETVHIKGFIPTKLRSKDPIQVKIVLIDIHEGELRFGTGVPVYKIKCIEKED